MSAKRDWKPSGVNHLKRKRKLGFLRIEVLHKMYSMQNIHSNHYNSNNVINLLALVSHHREFLPSSVEVYLIVPSNEKHC